MPEVVGCGDAWAVALEWSGVCRPLGAVGHWLRGLGENPMGCSVFGFGAGSGPGPGCSGSIGAGCFGSGGVAFLAAAGAPGRGVFRPEILTCLTTV